MSTLNDSLLGKQVDEYRIDRALGQGGMARVYRALDVKLERYVALKVIAPDFRTDQEYASRFTREAQSIARLNHPNIVHIYRFGEADGIYYMAMEYVEGADVGWLIEDYRASGELMPIPDVVRIVQDIGSALDFSHSKNVIHRDIKPSNIMVDGQGRAILTDFGLALLSDQGTHGQIFGSPHYISPEQAISSGNVVPQSDLYSLGVTLFEMLTGDLPFADGEPMDIAMRHVSETPPPPSQFNRAIPSNIDQIVLKSLAKEPFERFLTGAEFSAALKEAVDSWQSGGQPNSEGPRRPSLISAPQKVDELMRISPVPARPTPLPVTRSRERLTAENTQPPPLANPTQPAPPSKATRQQSGWFYPLLLAVALFILGLIGLFLIVLLPHNDNSAGVAAAPTVTITTSQTEPPATVPFTQTPIVPSNTSIAQAPTAIPTFTPVVLPTIVPSPTSIATPTAVIIPTLVPSPTPMPPPATFLPTNSSTITPPDNRDVIPAGSIRLGDFAVEAYCNSRGYGITLVNNNSDWACTNASGGGVVIILQPSDFDNICRNLYSDPNAFAIRDQHKATPAYNWSCYAYISPPTAVPPTSVPAATPSALTLFLTYKADWVALTNISTVPLSLTQLQFTHEDRTMNSSAWGRGVLNPGECLRIFKGDKPPKDLPQKCNTVFDYNADKKEREYWLKGPVIITISSSVSYCYPSKECPS